MSLHCVSCDDPFREEDIQYHSGLSGASDDDILCQMCNEVEEEWFRDHGNFHPKLLASYVFRNVK